jgi:ribosomal protein S5
MRVSTTTIVHDGSEEPGIKICVGASGVQGSVTMCTDKARQVRDAIDKALKLG